MKEKTKKKLDPAVKTLRDDLTKTLGRLRRTRELAVTHFDNGRLNGGKMRNLDDAECWLADARGALTDFLKG